MRLTRVTVKGLFGLFDHDIPFGLGASVAIIHGPNGFGKTVVLRMIRALVSGEVSIFEQIPFSEFWLSFDDGRRIGAIRGDDQPVGSAKPLISFRSVLADGTAREIPAGRRVPSQVLDQIDRFVPRMSRYLDGWRDIDGTTVSLAEVLRRFPGVIEQLPPKIRKSIAQPSIEGFSIFFVETNRLFASDEARSDRFQFVGRYDYPGQFFPDDDESAHVPQLRVVQYSADLTRRLQTVLADYAKHSQERDRTYPERLVQFLRTQQAALTNREILEQMSALDGSRQRLIDLGFLDTERGLTDLTEEDVNRAREALTIYVGDVREKLKVFDDMQLRVGKLTDIVNSRYRYKTLKIDRNSGLKFVGNDDKKMDLASLSSGEQHELVLLYELLFMVPRNGLVLIDEPEISLHVGWQSRFLEDLLGILEVTGAHALIATHAPAIVGNRWDLTVQLRGPEASGGPSSDL